MAAWCAGCAGWPQDPCGCAILRETSDPQWGDDALTPGPRPAQVEAKKAVPKEEHPSGRTFDAGNPQRTKKVFVGGLAPSVDENVLKAYFERFGEVGTLDRLH